MAGSGRKSRILRGALAVLCGLCVPFQISADAHDGNPKLKALALTGGESPENTSANFYRHTEDFAVLLNSLGVPRDRKRIYFGRDGGKICHTQASREANQYVSWIRENALTTQPVPPEVCSAAIDYIGGSEFGLNELMGKPVPGSAKGRPTLFQAVNEEICNYDRTAELAKAKKEGAETPRKTRRRVNPKLGDFDGDGKRDVNGDSSLTNLKQGIAELGLTQGDHFLINLSDHGAKRTRKNAQGETFADWSIQLGTGEKIWASELAPLLKDLNQRGVTVHLNTQACFSGGFVQALTRASEGPGTGATCVTSQTSADVIGYSADAMFQDTVDATFQKDLAEFGNQLEALACSMAHDTVNQPKTSLDQIVEAGLASMPIEVPTYTACAETQNGHEDIRKNAELILTAVDQFLPETREKLRKGLLDLYREKFAKRLANCLSRPRGSDIALKKNLALCLTQEDAFAEMIQDLSQVRTGPQYTLNLVNYHAHFLKLADDKGLQRYKDAICCLSYDLKAGAVPEICR